MEDKGAFVFLNKSKWIFVIVIIVSIILLAIYFFGKSANENNLKDYLTENNYKREGQTYFKTLNENDGSTTSTINYIFSIKANKFTKNIDSSTNVSRENIQLQYNGTKTISIFYYKEDYTNDSLASISQNADYNMDNDEYKCTLVSLKGDIKSQCAYIKKEAKNFSNEIKKLLDDANINEFFTTKNSKDI